MSDEHFEEHCRCITTTSVRCVPLQVWYMSVMSILKNIAANGLLFWLPIIVASLLRGRIATPHILANVTATPKAGGSSPSRQLLGGGGVPLVGDRPQLSLPVLLSSVPFVCNAGFAIFLGRSSQATGDLAMHLTLPYLTAGLIFAALQHLREASHVAAFVALCIALPCTIGTNWWVPKMG